LLTALWSDEALTDEPDEFVDPDVVAPGAGSGDGVLDEPLVAGCGEGSGCGDAAARVGTASVKSTRQSAQITLPPGRATMDAAEARAIRVAEPPCRVRQNGRARISPFGDLPGSRRPTIPLRLR
jgi:hypothetical protein